jgi:hypothetical protein
LVEYIDARNIWQIYLDQKEKQNLRKELFQGDDAKSTRWFNFNTLKLLLREILSRLPGTSWRYIYSDETSRGSR